jgi:hypothetical protein
MRRRARPPSPSCPASCALLFALPLILGSCGAPNTSDAGPDGAPHDGGAVDADRDASLVDASPGDAPPSDAPSPLDDAGRRCTTVATAAADCDDGNPRTTDMCFVGGAPGRRGLLPLLRVLDGCRVRRRRSHHRGSLQRRLVPLRALGLAQSMPCGCGLHERAHPELRLRGLRRARALLVRLVRGLWDRATRGLADLRRRRSPRGRDLLRWSGMHVRLHALWGRRRLPSPPRVSGRALHPDRARGCGVPLGSLPARAAGRCSILLQPRRGVRLRAPTPDAQRRRTQ